MATAMAKPSHATIIAALEQEPLAASPSLPPPTPIPPPLVTVKTELYQPEQQKPQEEEPTFFKSINDLASHASAILAFKSKFDELTKHLDFINKAIDSKFNEPQQEEQHPKIEPQPCLKSTQTKYETVRKGPKAAPPPKSSCDGIQSHCMSMRSKMVRKYIVKRLSLLPMLREEVPVALKLAPEPAKLVLDSIGKSFLMGKNAYTKEVSARWSREANLLLLEFFLLMIGGEGEIKISANVKVEAENRAVAWRKRLNDEGGLCKASAADARGLLLYVSCFGIPKVFSNEDLRFLLKLSDLKGISDAVKASPWLPGKMPGIIKSMAKNGMHFEAGEVASIFGLEDKFSPKTILTSFLQESTKAFEREKVVARKSPVLLRRANEKLLAALKSIVRYLENRGSDAMELSCLVKEKIVKLEEEIAAGLDKRIVKKKELKRKLDEMGSSSTIKSQEMKCSRFDTKGSPLPKSHVNQLHEQPTAILAEGNGLVPNSCNANNDPVASSALHGSTCSFPGNETVQMGGTTGVESSDIGVIPASSILTEGDDLVPNSCNANNDLVASSTPHGSTCSLRGNETGQMEVTTGVESSDIGVIPASSYSGADGAIEVGKADQMMSENGLTYGRHGCGVQSASMWFVGLFGSSLSLEGFVGLPDNSVRTSADLYRFADTLG
ncbi:protein FRIGIDA-like [Hibiscus syriacus]|uniref:protein FRIGIDA-like n=1 Tax=Hibiscus syriacus TaxID=106335 RepID=UPI001920A829|nr:protein FRIGIDA-like [Hibiscus syriacus]